MAEYEDTSAALRRVEAALNRIAAQVAKPRPASADETVSFEGPAKETAAEPAGVATAAPVDDQTRHEIVTKLDDLIGGLRNALGLERQP
ncbi:MAG TPA: hypothetical protein VL752_06820 [Acidisoma sp.]|uniref:hypothetical protein n=1 Tax=Acidisoma sp. TaxID=1872115 RepID=UPI002C1C48A0|nr:hypothetical protein [Acidisoma sp.]HTI00645.1 hypothetical protein [Acidisoma sp.]